MTQIERFICIHGHFYQPPRENPWLEAIEWQESARPYHDWNERITAECYGPNTVAPILDPAGRVVAIRNNYEWISFNFGPTLLAWLKTHAPEIYAQVLAADAASARRFGGHGSALAQAYNHIIMPLANARDKETQIIWGIRDFASRFGRAPEGMWLPETAVDEETLDLMAAQGIKFTILEPHQATRVRKLGEKTWTELHGAELDPSRAYRAMLPSGRSISVFFYQGPISRAVAFERLLHKGEFLAERLVAAFDDQRTWPQLVHIATDGETFGHHHRFGEMALAYALDHIERENLARITNYGEYLANFPPTHEVIIRSDTSWSCAHGIERWRLGCGCNSGGQAGWNQEWRAPLRDTLDWLRDALAPIFEKSARAWTRDPWGARNAYIDVVLDRTTPNLDRFFAAQSFQPPVGEQRVRALQALEMQRNAMLMFTSCGWFFDDLSGIETVQCMQYALRAIQLAHQLTGTNNEEDFVSRIERAQSNVPGMGNGREVWARLVRPAVLGLSGVAAHYGISSMFENYGPQTEIYSYRAELLNEAAFEVGRRRLRIGRVRVTSKITEKTAAVTYGVLHLGEHNLHAGVSHDADGKVFQHISDEGARVFGTGELPEIIRLLDQFFKGETYSLRSLFKDELRRILEQVLSHTLTNAETVYRQLYEEYAPLMNYLREMGMPLPAALRTAAEFALNSHMRRAIGARRLDLEPIQAMLAEASGAHLTLDMDAIESTLRAHLESVAECIWRAPQEQSILQRLASMLSVARLFPFEISLWRVRIVFLLLLRDFLETGGLPGRIQSRLAPESRAEWLQALLEVGEKLHIAVNADTLPNIALPAAQSAASLAAVNLFPVFHRPGR